MESFVYIAICPNYSELSPLAVKVGSSKNPEGRVKSFERYYISGKSFALIAKYPLQSRSSAYAMERLVQNLAINKMLHLQYSELFKGSAESLGELIAGAEKIHNGLLEAGL